ncbi:MAG: acyl carrier protein [Gammaproteobacteria bacterium]|nr:acyl carrier protein [Gammaproteobacteria bacterium]
MNNPLDLSEVIESTREILAQLLAMDVEDISVDASITEDLGADSLDIVDLSFQLGRRYGCALPKINVLDHAQAVCGSVSAFISGGGLTEAGIALMRGSLSAYSAEQLRLGMRPAEIFAATTVRNWAQQCHNLFQHLPASCPECAAKHAQLNERHQVVCSGCSARLSPVDGDEASRRLVQRFVAPDMKAVA